jgi:hypothetical protein
LILFKTSNAGEPQQRNRIPNIWGANVKLGQLYDGRRDQLLDLELFTPKTVEDNLQTAVVTNVENDFKIYRSFLERIDDISIKASLKLSFMGGLISVSGSAKYLHDGKILISYEIPTYVNICIVWTVNDVLGNIFFFVKHTVRVPLKAALDLKLFYNISCSEKWGKKIQATAYNGTHTVDILSFLLFYSRI